jgi:hypothetical protein
MEEKLKYGKIRKTKGFVSIEGYKIVGARDYLHLNNNTPVAYELVTRRFNGVPETTAVIREINPSQKESLFDKSKKIIFNELKNLGGEYKKAQEMVNFLLNQGNLEGAYHVVQGHKNLCEKDLLNGKKVHKYWGALMNAGNKLENLLSYKEL